MQIAPHTVPRVALFPDTYFEANGVATLSRHLAQFAKERNYPLLIVRGGSQTTASRDGSIEFLELKRSAASFPLDKSLYFDPLLSRYKQLVLDKFASFKPDLVHMTGPGDLGFLALLVSHAAHVPLIASWHTNLHEYLSRRLDSGLRLLPASLRHRIGALSERQALRGLLRFYRTSRFVFAPNQEQVDLLHSRLGKPAFVMPHGVDLSVYHPIAALTENRPFCIGYVGRLTTEKNVRYLAALEQSLIARGEKDFQFLIVGDGGQQSWLQSNLRHAELTGVLRGAQLAAAYNRMDAFVFPSKTDTFGLVILEAMASGVPVVVPPLAGSRVGVKDGVSGFVADDFTDAIVSLMRNPVLCRQIGSAARHFAERYSWNVVFEHVYQSYAQGLAYINRPLAA